MERRGGDQCVPFCARGRDVSRLRLGDFCDFVVELWRAELFAEVAEDALCRTRAPVLREVVFVSSEPRIDEGDVRRAEFRGPELTVDADNRVRDLRGVAFAAVAVEGREGRCDCWPARRCFGRAMASCASSKACASSGVWNDLRLRTPLRSYQSARYRFPF